MMLLLMLLALLLALSSHRLSGCTVDFMPPKAVDGVLTRYPKEDHDSEHNWTILLYAGLSTREAVMVGT